MRRVAIIGTSMASRGLYAAQKKGVRVDDDVLKRVKIYTRSNFDDKSGKFKDSGNAGVDLYQVAQALEESSRMPSAGAPAADRAMVNSAESMLGSKRMLAGFGSMGGEEFISYMNISDSLVRKGGKSWSKWNDGIKTRLVKLQNKDGTWAGHHCITGRTVCTSAALLVLMVDRTQVPLSAKIGQK